MKARILSIIMAAGLIAAPAATAWAEETQSVEAFTAVEAAPDSAAIEPDALGQFAAGAGSLAGAQQDFASQGGMAQDTGDTGAASGAQSGDSFDTLWDGLYAEIQEPKSPSWGTSSEDMSGMQSTLDQLYGAAGGGQGAEVATAIMGAMGGSSLTDSIASAFGVTLDKTPLFTAEEMGFDASANVDFGVLNESYAGMIVGMSQAEREAGVNLSSGATSCMDGFNAAFGNINEMKLEAAELPQGFNPDSMLQASMQGFEAAYGSALGSDAFQTAKSKIGIGNVFQLAEQGVNMDLSSLLESSSDTYARLQGGAGLTGGQIREEFAGYASDAEEKGKAAPSTEDMLGLKTDAITNAWKVIDMSNCMATDEKGKIQSTNKPNGAANMTIGSFRNTLDTWQANRNESLSATLNNAAEKRKVITDMAIDSMAGDDPERLQDKLRELYGATWSERLQSGGVPENLQQDSAPHTTNLDGIRTDMPPLTEAQLNEEKEAERLRGVKTEEESLAVYREFQEKYYKESQEQRAALGN